MTALNPFQRHVLIGTAIRMRGGRATNRQIGETTGLDLTRINADLIDMEREKTVRRVRNEEYVTGTHFAAATSHAPFFWELTETAA